MVVRVVNPLAKNAERAIALIRSMPVRTRGKNPYIQDSAEWRAFEASREDLPARSVRVYPSMDAFLDDLETLGRNLV